MADPLTFYTNPQSRGAIVRWMLEEVGTAYDTQVLEYGAGMQSAEYLAINPMGKVPAIVHHGVVVTESAAICAYLADAFPQAGLAPPPDQRGEYYRWLFFGAGPLDNAVIARAMGFYPDTEQQRMAGFGSYDRMVGALEQWLTDREFIAGDTFTAADVYVGAQVGWGLQYNTIDKRPAFEKYWAGVSARAAHQRAVAIDDALIATG